MKRGHAVWAWVTSVLGAALVLLMGGQVLSESLWLGQQGQTTGNYSYMPLYLGGLVGVILAGSLLSLRIGAVRLSTHYRSSLSGRLYLSADEP